jgi:hypothetical protein
MAPKLREVCLESAIGAAPGGKDRFPNFHRNLLPISPRSGPSPHASLRAHWRQRFLLVPGRRIGPARLELVL